MEFVRKFEWLNIQCPHDSKKHLNEHPFIIMVSVMMVSNNRILFGFIVEIFEFKVCEV